MLPLLLIIIFSLFVFYCVLFMLRRGHDLHAFAFLTLYIYSIFTQIGYVFFPELSVFIGAYYGPMLFYKYWAFMFFSFVLTFFLYKKIFPRNDKKQTYFVKPLNSKIGENLFFIIVIVLYLLLNLYFIVYRDMFQYGSTMGGPWFGIGFWVFTVCTVILFSLFRDKSNSRRKRRFSAILFFICTLFLITVAIASGVRSTILYFFIGLLLYEIFPLRNKIKNKRKIFTYSLIGIFLVFSLNILRELRTQGEDISFTSFLNFERGQTSFSNQNLSSTLLAQDYFYPSHTLFISMYYEIIDPIEVLKSNLANSLVLLKYPFLSTLIVEKATGEKHERGRGWSYHYFVEGYNVMGMLGVFYNALFWNLGMLLWFKLTRTTNKNHNKAMIAISGLVIILVMRSQTSAFIQFYWMILLIGLVLLLLANNSKIAFLKNNNSPGKIE